MTLLTLLIIIMKFYYNTRHQKSFKNVISDDKGRIRKQTISIPKMLKIYFNHWLSNKKLGTIIDKNGKK